MSFDALIIADYDIDSVSGSSPMRLMIDEQPATIQTIYNYLDHHGKVIPPIFGDKQLSWSSAYKLNGIALLSTLQQHGYKTMLVNSLSQDFDLFVELARQQPLAIVISTTFIVNKTSLNSLVKCIRAVAPNIPIIAGGPFVYQSYLIHLRREEPEFSLPQLQIDYLFWNADEPDIDLYVTSLQGQQSLREALDRLRRSQSLRDIPDTAWQDANGRYQFQPGQSDSPPAKLDFQIDWDRLPDDIFTSKVVPLQASSGCPFRCAFCNFVKDHQNTYAKSAEQIVDEMSAVARRGAKYIWFVDDIFRLGHGDLTATSEAIIEADLNVKWMTFIRADTVKAVDFDLLKDAGCHELQFGLESADPSVLEAMNKKVDPEIYRSTIEKALAAGINVSAYFLFGHPGETRQSLDRTIAFMREIQFPDLPGSLSWSIYPFLLVPLSPIYESSQRSIYGLQGYMQDWQHATMDFTTAMNGIRQAVMALEKSAPIYRTDNLEMLDDLGCERRKAFFRARLQLAKLATMDELDPKTTYQTFASILHNP